MEAANEAGEESGPYVSVVDDAALQADLSGALSTLLEELGKSSASAQGLRRPVTSGSCLGDQRVYLLMDGPKALGFLKVGRKRLFVEAVKPSDFADVKNAFQEIEPLCALDFYVHERYQRAGFGRQLFDAMMRRERLSAQELGYDRPSPKLLCFLKKHYSLSKYKPQNNNFVVYEDFWTRPGSVWADRSQDRRISCRQSAGCQRAARPARQEGQKDLFSRTAEHQHVSCRAAPIF